MTSSGFSSGEPLRDQPLDSSLKGFERCFLPLRCSNAQFPLGKSCITQLAVRELSRECSTGQAAAAWPTLSSEHVMATT